MAFSNSSISWLLNWPVGIFWYVLSLRCGIIFLRHHLNLLSLTPPDLQSIRVGTATARETGAFDLQQPVHLDAEYLYLAAGCLSEEQTLLAVVSALPHLPVRALLVPVVRKVSSKRVAAHGVEVSLLPVIGGIGALPRALLSSSKELLTSVSYIHL